MIANLCPSVLHRKSQDGPSNTCSHTSLFRSVSQPSSNYILHWFSQAQLWGLVFRALASWAGKPGVELGLLAPQRGPRWPSYPSRYLTPTCGLGPVHSASLPLIPVSRWLSLYALRCRICVQLDSSCNFDGLMGQGKHSTHLPCHLEWPHRLS